MSSAGISYPQWLARFGVPVVFRDDGKPFQDPLDLRSATPDEIRQAGYIMSDPDALFARLARRCTDADGKPTTEAIILAVWHVPTMNAASDRELQRLWRNLTGFGFHVFTLTNP